MTMVTLHPLEESNQMGYNYSRLVDIFMEHEFLVKDDYVKKNLVELHVYLASAEMQVIQENVDYSLGSLFSDMGGVIGLFRRRAKE
jgi:hypothetical protein